MYDMNILIKEMKEFWLVLAFLILGYFVLQFDIVAFWVYKIFLGLLPIVITITLGIITYFFWLHYIRANFISGIDWVLLEIVPPRDVERSPKAMELFITNALYHTSMKSGLELYWQGAVWFWFSLEIASIDGQVHFYVRTPTRTKGLLETQIYAQFPQAQVKVVEDYTLAVDKISPESKWNLWGCEFSLLKPDSFPIKTYVDFGLDKDPKEEYKIDPIAPVIELFGSIGKGEQMWMQIVVTPSKKEYPVHAGIFTKTHDWVKQAEMELDKIAKPYTKIEHFPDGSIQKSGRTPDSVRPLIDAINRKMMKVGFDTGIRVCYVAKKEVFDMSNRRNIRLIFRQYAQPYINQLERINSTQADAFGTNFLATFFPLSNKKVMRLADRMLEEYREREFFHPPMRHKIHLPWPISPVLFPNFFHHHINVLNTEEIATLWHFPGQILKVPTLERIESKEASPPTNLPI
ncbi:MAG: hypothetical protein UR25_C0001G0084 [Candidatus Nomurabacteria bacterium GW2011_GWE1_32_28]|uniref:DUF8128 domain-containing protein n=1 Tax=Candidatus Nomurabacteria bacterium GW2011_GWF1_31_48 TaxID=1618767 RepID=A0A0F9YGZ6_9BACT|nr:MAG: hypothetical protein UR10_C0001G0037 [Candidatus Nomurabacteria bacterium GW2011_GWF2_30_133]KKP28915.1 MAG: hypothetical protein UR18_C0001G0036 [Candidatus Nomurabacteria bacterium GW2011_GWE2_31_40]KKP30653.1 MAG: hypothetical protein UR19_C0001G0037 [Candidatus Nomurabacteria bacterium GW2011_GWF1_31_48]KKP35171.1 MAG: hypothetical protein UR25_C0001G0084 [Candidatus Nomurabacteria bacterium GW2011_GWE1_32_28]HAS80480.1 hypothetical protein [Candidatus Nomurabacteria bacterium]